MNVSNRDYRYLDGESDRRELIAEFHRVREAVIQVAQTVPENRRYEPRYHGWSLGALLAHLYVSDRLALWAIQWALVGVRPPVPSPVLHGFNDLSARIFQKRVTGATIRGIRGLERRIADFTLRLPMDKFTHQVWDPSADQYLTVERAVQVAFLFHWQEHLITLQKVEGVFYEPPERFDTL